MHHYTINFAHANGFPASSYQTLFNYLPSHINVIALDQYGHDPKRPINHNWQAQVEELIVYVESQQIDNIKVIAAGHSFGGVISFIACCQRPDLFSGLVMLDPPVLTGLDAFALKVLKKTPWIDKFSPAGKAKNRRKKWPLGTDIAAMFARRSLFRDFDARCLHDYIQHGIIEQNGQLTLVFDAKVETDIFRHLPSHLSRYKNKLTVPATLIYGDKTEVFPKRIFKQFVNFNPHIKLQTTSGGHMFPLEHPEEAARLIAEFVEKIKCKK